MTESATLDDRIAARYSVDRAKKLKAEAEEARAATIKRRKQIWDALHPEGGRISPTLGGEQKVGFAADTASVSGESKRRINEHLSRAEALGDDLLKVAGTTCRILESDTAWPRATC